jgi:hypothetical protein
VPASRTYGAPSFFLRVSGRKTVHAPVFAVWFTAGTAFAAARASSASGLSWAALRGKEEKRKGVRQNLCARGREDTVAFFAARAARYRTRGRDLQRRLDYNVSLVDKTDRVPAPHGPRSRLKRRAERGIKNVASALALSLVRAPSGFTPPIISPLFHVRSLL